ncbi:unnamed protein product [Medioppia subpectinata]|uniref:HORMA domain-containing protein n=1 Tax=Medioppia subpectinata TaxID=1979941 RepID=A0A7R9L7A3_9ACAR|nr:unnamed protein product [Medioppia subpectinata]CAG2115716.1 unnamed protein product [Medioppia subpectinata]
MTTLQKQRDTETRSQQQQLFPLSVVSEQMSLNYMKRLTAVAISNILYLRNVFTEDCYGHRKLDHLKLRILTEKCQTVGAKQIVHWVKGCFDAMEKKYLKQLTLGVFTDPSAPEELIEAYTLRYSYDTNNKLNCDLSVTKDKTERVVCEQTLNQELRQSTVQLLRSLLVMIQSLDRLPADCYLTMKLMYYDDITPKDYEPPGFVAAERDSFTFNGKPISITAGQVVTPYHSLKVKIRTNQGQFQDWASTPDSDTYETQPKSQELIDDPPLVPIEDPIVEIHDKQWTKSGDNTRHKSGTKSTITETSKVNDKSATNELSDWLQTMAPQTSSSRPKCRPENSETKVISKIKELSVDEVSDTHKRKLDFEVTQDSMFNAMANSGDKRFKVSQSGKKLSIATKSYKKPLDFL